MVTAALQRELEAACASLNEEITKLPAALISWCVELTGPARSGTVRDR